MNAPGIVIGFFAYFGAYLIPVLYIAGSLGLGPAQKKMWWGMAIHTFWNLVVWGFVYYSWSEGYREYYWGWVLLFPVNVVSAIYYIGAIFVDHTRSSKRGQSV